MKKNSISYNIFSIANSAFFIFFAFLCIVPFIHVIAVSFSDAAANAANNIGLLPKGFQFDAYKKLFIDSSVFKAFSITLTRMLLGMLYSMILTICAAYPLAFDKREFPGRTAFVIFFFFSMLFSGGIIPYYILMNDLNLTNSIWVLILGTLPVGNAIILMNFFRSLPRELYESANLDGASHFGILIKIFVPLSKPSLSTLSLLCLVGHWNDWFSGLIFMTDPVKYPLQTYIYNAMQDTSFYSATGSGAQSAPRQAVIGALIILSIIPVVTVLPFLSKHIEKGIVLGSVKQ